MIRPYPHGSPMLILRAQPLVLIALVFASILAVRSEGSAGAGPTLTGQNVRVSTHDFFPNDSFFSPTGAPDVLQQNEPSVAVHPLNRNLIAVGMNDVRTLAISDDAWQGLAVRRKRKRLLSTNIRARRSTGTSTSAGRGSRDFKIT